METTVIKIVEVLQSEDNVSIQRENKMLKSQILLLEKVIRELENVNMLQKRRIEFLERDQPKIMNTTSENKMSPSYSAAVKINNAKNILIVKPVNSKQTSSVTCQEIKHALNPVELSVEINNVVPRKDGSVMINCKDAKNIEILKSNITNKIGKSYNTVVPKKINPKILIEKVSADDILDRDKFSDNVFSQNRLQKLATTVFPIVRVINKKPNNVNVIVEADPATFKDIIGRENLYIGWRRCRVRESYHVIRCFKCSRYGYFSKECKSLEQCPKCGGNHNFKD
ncbi:hypothetical protein MML48_2g00007963 [Holotrichia oblita]|uniref:Uncharacterized protein n=1 Tax=Holotrichia oblita TaxID=644536 RepID=A0ACB9TME7_HOLOL|nr:hypothetical protein MML48_2g00007963 [Holotrichia oblita]